MQALQSPDTSTRRACAIYDANQVRLHLTFPAAYSGNLHIYVLDWDSTARRETVTINDGSGPADRQHHHRLLAGRVDQRPDQRRRRRHGDDRP